MLTPQDLRPLRDKIGRLEAQVNFLYEHLGIEYVPESRVDDDPRMIEAIKKGDILGAMRIYREIHGVGADEAKDGVAEVKGRLGL